MNAHQARAIKALEQYKGDNLYRAKMSFSGLPANVMAEQYGQSGKTRQQIIDEYQQHEDACNETIAWIKSL